MNEKKITRFFIIITVALCISIALSAVTLYGQSQTKKKIFEIQGLSEDVDREDDVTIAGNYTIKSTLNISDAYKSGDTSKLSDSEKETLDLAKAVIGEVITDKMSDFEKERAIYDWLTSKLTANRGILTVVPARDGDNDNPHDVLKYHSAVCVGYATTFRMFMQMFGIECKVVHSSDLTHSWDLVKLDDGWYHTDCFSDSDSNTYQNFNMDDNRCRQNHTWTKEYYPSATGKKYNYIFSICEENDDIYSVPAWITQAIIDKKTVVSCTFKEKINEDNEKKAQYMVERIADRLGEENGFSVEYDWMLDYNNQYVLCFYINYYDDPTEVDDETAQMVEEAISEAMDNYYNEVY